MITGRNSENIKHICNKTAILVLENLREKIIKLSGSKKFVEAIVSGAVKFLFP